MTAQTEGKMRILVAKPGIDVHDRGALLLCKAFTDAGMEVIYTGLWQTPETIAAAATQEDVDAIAVSMLDGQPLYVFGRLMDELKKIGGDNICVIGGGTAITAQEGIIPRLEKIGVSGLYGPGTPLKTIVNHVVEVARMRRSTLKT